MKATENMALAMKEDIEKLETTMPTIKEQLEQKVTELLDTTSIIRSEDIQLVSQYFDGVLSLLQNYDGKLLSFIRSMVKSGAIPINTQDAVKSARQRVQDMSGEIAWSRERLVSQVDIHNAGLGFFTFLSVGKDGDKPQEPDECGHVPVETSGEDNTPAPDAVTDLVCEDA